MYHGVIVWVQTPSGTYIFHSKFSVSNFASTKYVQQLATKPGHPAVIIRLPFDFVLFGVVRLTSDYCPLGFTDPSRSGICYRHFLEELSFDDAATECSKLNAFLAMPLSDEENSRVADFIYMEPDSSASWIGVHDMDVEGTFKMLKGEAATYLNWREGMWFEKIIISKFNETRVLRSNIVLVPNSLFSFIWL